MPGYWAQARSWKAVYACAQELSSVWLCSPMNMARQAPLSMRILQTRIVERVAISSSRGSSPPRDGTCVSCSSCIGRWVLYGWSLPLGSPLRGLVLAVRKEPEMATSGKYCFWGQNSCFDKRVVSLQERTVKGKKEIKGEIKRNKSWQWPHFTPTYTQLPPLKHLLKELLRKRRTSKTP